MAVCQSLFSFFPSHQEHGPHVSNFVSLNSRCQNTYWFLCPPASTQEDLILSVQHPAIIASKYIQEKKADAKHQLTVFGSYFPFFLIKTFSCCSGNTDLPQTIPFYPEIEIRASICILHLKFISLKEFNPLSYSVGYMLYYHYQLHRRKLSPRLLKELGQSYVAS